GYSTRDFRHQYPTSSLIEAQYQSGNKTFYNWYNVQSLGYYPTQLKFTQKISKEGIQYPIPDEHSVKTSLIKKQIQYSDKSASNVISSFLKHHNYSKMELSGPRIFGFDI
ncbi:24507_t:CDS:2, partial [Gigaspora rosea]